MNKLLTLSLAAAALMTAPAFAADLGVYAPAPSYSDPIEMAPANVVQVKDWTGAYVGVIGGYARGESEHTVPGSAVFDVDGWTIGGEAGYNFHLDNDVVVGVAGDLSWTNLDGETGVTKTDIDWLGTVRGRVGYAFDTFVPYVTGGFALADVNAEGAGYSIKELQAGWTAGAGAELAVGENLSVKAEYLYVDLNGDTVFGDNPAQVPETRTHVIRLGTGFKF